MQNYPVGKELIIFLCLGHSRTIVGIEILKDKSVRLLIFDPSTSKKQINLFHSIVNANLMRTLRRSIQGLKSKQYQIVAVTGVISDHEYDVSIGVLVFKTNYRLMQVVSIAECSKGSILQYFRPSLSYHLSLRSLFCLF